MNWEAIGAAGELVGALAVILTVGYLAVQIRQNTRSTQATVYSETTRGWHDYLQFLSTEDVELLIALATRHTELSNPEFYRAYYLCRVLFRRMEHDYYQFQSGVLEAGTWRAYLDAFREDTFNNPGVRAMWSLQSGYLDPKFSAVMAPILERASSEAQPNVRKRFAEALEAEISRATNKHG